MTVVKMTIGERIKTIRKEKKMTQGEFGKHISLVASAICQLENGTASLTERVQKDICREFNINPNWLLFGTGEMHVTQSDCLVEEFEEIINKYPSLYETVKLVSKHMTNDDWQRVNELLKEMGGQG